MTTLRRLYTFYIRREHGGLIEKITVEAKDSAAAINLLPPCVYWDFAA